MWVGADRIAANGDVANKIGTYSLAVWPIITRSRLRRCPQTTSTAIARTGRRSREQRGGGSDRRAGSFGAVQWAPTGPPFTIRRSTSRLLG